MLLSRRITRLLASQIIQVPFPGAGMVLRNLHRLGLKKPTTEIEIPTVEGDIIRIDPRLQNRLALILYFNGIYEAGTLATMAACLAPGDTVIDAGANVGLMSVFASRRVGASGRVFAFEPHGQTHTAMKKNLQINACTNVETFQQALGDQRGIATLFEYDDHNRGTATMVARNSTAREIEVTVQTLDAFLEERGWPTIKLLKIDVEGWEVPIMRGAHRLLSGPSAPVVVFEHNMRISVSENHSRLDTLLELNQFALFRLQFGKETLSPLVSVDPANPPRHDNLIAIPENRLDFIDAMSGTRPVELGRMWFQKRP
ncbi:MAG: FkbM family methyltransferase [Gammaproteobacteria bacterium]